MIELRRLRTFIPKGQTDTEVADKGFEPPVYFDGINDLLKTHKQVLQGIDEHERYNLYVTCNEVDPQHTKRADSWLKQELIMWDIDDVTDDDRIKHEKYLKVVAESLGVKPKQVVITSTGGGFHVLLRIKKAITTKEWFAEQALNYQILCIQMDEKLHELGLSGTLDRQVFAPNRMFRLPETISKKPGRQDKKVTLLQGETLEAIDWDIQKATGLPNLMPEKDFMSEKELSYIKVDSGEVEKGCSFLEWAKKRPHEINEPTWYAVLSIVGRLDKGEEKAHAYSKGHPHYNPHKTDRKLEQALKSSGPRTCDNIDKLWHNCNKCPNYKKVRSPIALKGKNFIATAHSGFHTISPKGQLIPQYDDLRKFYDKEAPYVNSANTHYKFESSHWREKPDVFIDNYAEHKFLPAPKNNMRAEFRGKIKCTNLKDPEWFNNKTHRMLNFQNGVLNIDTMELQEHSPEHGFCDTLPFDYDPKAECPEFRTMLDNITCGDHSKQTVLMEFLGYSLSNDSPKADKILVLTGEGQNGKSRFLNVWKALGGAGVRSLGITELQNPFMLQRLDGALFNISEEVPSFTKKDFWEVMKNLATGGTITVSRKFKDPYDFNNKAKFIMTCNRLPQGADQNHGYFRRLLLVDFAALFTENTAAVDNSTTFPIDRGIDQRIITNEMPGVANIAIKMYHRLRDNNYEFSRSEAIEATLKAYRKELDSVDRWGEEYIELGVTSRETTHQDAVVETENGCAVVVEELRKDYARWCLDNGEKPVSTRLFARRLMDFIHSLGAISVEDRVNPQWTKRVPDGHQITKMRVRVGGARKIAIQGVIYGSAEMCEY